MGTKEDIAERRAVNATGNGTGGISLPDRGTSTGLNGDTYGADLSADATNSLGKMGQDTGSHEAFQVHRESDEMTCAGGEC